MKVTINTPTLVSALGSLVGAVERRVTIPILSHVLLEAEGERLTLSATDLEVAVRISLPAQVEKPGRATVPILYLASVAGKLPGLPISIEVLENGWTAWRCGPTRLKFAGLRPEDFPQLPVPEGESAWMPFAELNAALKNVIFAASDKPDGQTLAAVLIHEGEFVTTDGHRLALFRAGWAAGVKSMLLTRKVAAVLADMQTKEALVAVRQSEQHVSFACADWQIWSRRLTGKFPNWKAAVPPAEDYAIHLRMPAAELAERAARVGTAAEENNAILLEFSKGKLELSARSANVGEALDEMKVVGAADFRVSINYRYLLEFLERVKGEVEVSFSQPERAVLLKGGEAHSYYVMPMRI